MAAHTVKPVSGSIKQPTCIKQPEESCPKIHRPIYLNCIKQPPAWLLKTGLTVIVRINSGCACMSAINCGCECISGDQ